MQECIFCKIINRELPAEIVYEDEQILAFKDVNPVAPVHLLLIPKKHISGISDLKEEDAGIMGRMQVLAANLAAEMGLVQDGFRLVCNCGRDAGQLVMHIHYHLLSGREFQWPPG
jgi:histidine triad (HIT) family protein